MRLLWRKVVCCIFQQHHLFIVRAIFIGNIKSQLRGRRKFNGTIQHYRPYQIPVWLCRRCLCWWGRYPSSGAVVEHGIVGPALGFFIIVFFAPGHYYRRYSICIRYRIIIHLLGNAMVFCQ